jgi:hypothetical protein
MDDPFSRFDNRLETDTLTTKIQPLSLSLSLSIGNYYGPQKNGREIHPPSGAHHTTPSSPKNEGEKE